MIEQGSACFHTFLTYAQSYHNKVTPKDKLHAEKIVGAILLYAFTIAFPASLS